MVVFGNFRVVLEDFTWPAAGVMTRINVKCHPNIQPLWSHWQLKVSRVVWSTQLTHPKHCVHYSHKVDSIQSASPIDHIQLQKAISQVEQHHYGGVSYIWASAYWWKLNSVLIALRVIEQTEIAWVFYLHLELAEKLARLSTHLFQSGGQMMWYYASVGY